MINFPKSQPAPGCLAKEKLKPSGDYKCGDVLKRIKTDFCNKCYICESKAPDTINVEHFVAHQQNVELKFDWNNLYWSCGHCNNTKLAKYNNLLDCTKIDSNADTRLRIHLAPFPKEKVKVETQDDDPRTLETQSLLNDVYNGTTILKTIEAGNLRNEILREIRKFQELLFLYFDIDPVDDKELVLLKIKGHLSKNSAFTSIKRWIIRDHVKLFEEFGEFF